jgi:cytoskeleton-associated protein 5
MPASRVMQLYVDHGVASSSSKTRAAAMEQLAQLIKRRGDVAASATNATRTYRRIAEFISSADSATRSAALDCIAYMHQHTGNTVLTMIGELPPKERDLLKNRIDKMSSGTSTASPAVSSPPPPYASASSQALANGTNGASARGDVVSTPPGSPVPYKRAPNRTSIGSASSVPTRTIRSGVPSYTASEVSSHRSSRAETPTSSPRAEVEVASRGPRFRPLQPSACLDYQSQAPPPLSVEEENHRIRNSIRLIMDTDANRGVNALKELQRLLVSTPDEIMAYSNDLIEAIATRLQVIFSRPSTITQEASFRLCKHLIQTLSNFCDNSHLVEVVSGANLRSLIRELSLGLLVLDNTDGALKDMSKFMNMSILRLFATAGRIAIFE